VLLVDDASASEVLQASFACVAATAPKHDNAKDSRHVAPAWLLDLEKLDLPALR
jgi:hypothetical protein